MKLATFSISLLMLAVASQTAVAQEYTTDADGHTISTLPYQTSFDNTYNEYDGTSYMPIGWTSSGDNPFFTAAHQDYPAADGDYYLVSDNNLAGPRNEHIYTPFFVLEAGKEYTISFMLLMPGTDGRYPTFSLTAGAEQDFEFHNTELLQHSTADEAWQEITVKYIPVESGLCCFSFNFMSPVIYTGVAGLDNVVICSDQSALHPAASFSYDGLFSLMNSQVVCVQGAEVPFHSITRYVNNWDWTVTNSKGEKVLTSNEEHPRFAFPEEEDYTVTLKASNSKYSVETSQKFFVNFVEAEQSMWSPFATYSDNTHNIYQSGKTPTIGSDPYDFITGPNHYYRRFAERIELPQYATLSLQTIQYFINVSNFVSLQSGNIRSTPFRVTFYGEKEGKPDESNVLLRKESTMGEAFSTNTGGLGSSTTWSLPLEGSVKGAFYVALEFDENLAVDPWNQGGDRTYIDLSCNQHKSGVTSMYYFSNALQDWYPLHNLNEGLTGTGLNLILWGTLECGSLPESIQNVHGADDAGAIYDLQGQRVKGTKCSTPVFIKNGKKYLAR